MVDSKPGNINIHLNGISSQIKLSLGRVIQLTTFGLQASKSKKELSNSFPGAPISLLPPVPISNNIDEVRNEFNNWIICNGLCEAIESVGFALEETRKVCTVFSLVKPGEQITAEDFFSAISKNEKDFHKLFIPRKLNDLSQEFGPDILPESLKYIQTIIKARNCLVHRKGIVSKKYDKNNNDGILVEWQTYVFSIHNQHGEKQELTLPYLIKKDDRFFSRIDERKKLFHFGDKIKFTEKEFVEICMSLVFFGDDLVENVRKFGKQNGYYQ